MAGSMEQHSERSRVPIILPSAGTEIENENIPYT